MKKLLILSFCAVILLSVVSGSIAFFTDSVSTENVIASGSIDIVQHEYERAKAEDGSYTAQLQAYTQGQTIHPCVQTTPERAPFTIGAYTAQLYTSGMNNFVDKIVTVENIGDNHASVRTFIAVPATSEGISWIHLDQNTQDGWVWHEEILRSQEIDGKTYNIHAATNTLPLAPGATTAPSLLGFYLDSGFANRGDSYIFIDAAGKIHELGSDPEMVILVATDATQAIGYKGDEDALNLVFKDAHDALDTVFGAPGEHHPWASPAPQESTSPAP